MNAAGAVSDADLDQQTIGRDEQGRQRFTGFDGVGPLATDATLADVIARLNLLVKLGRGL